MSLTITHKGQSIAWPPSVDYAEAWIAGHAEGTGNRNADYLIVGRKSDFK